MVCRIRTSDWECTRAATARFGSVETEIKNLKPDFQSTNEKQSLVKEASSTAVRWQGPLGVGSRREHPSSSSDAYEGVGRGS